MVCWSVSGNNAVQWLVGASVTVRLSGGLLECQWQ